MGLHEQVDYDFSGPLQPQDLFGREYVTMGGVIDHHLTTTVQSHIKMPKKPVVTTNNGLFPVLGVAVQNQQISRFIVGLYLHVVVLLFHTYIDRFTFAEITHNTTADKYDAIIYIDECVTNEEKRAMV